jgi:hypothetical protein
MEQRRKTVRPDPPQSYPEGRHWESIYPPGKRWDCTRRGNTIEEGLEWWRMNLWTVRITL